MNSLRSNERSFSSKVMDLMRCAVSGGLLLFFFCSVSSYFVILSSSILIFLSFSVAFFSAFIFSAANLFIFYPMNLFYFCSDSLYCLQLLLRSWFYYHCFLSRVQLSCRELNYLLRWETYSKSLSVITCTLASC